MANEILTNKQIRFCEEYILDWNATRAAKAAGYSEKTARQLGSDTLAKAYIQDYIAEIQKDLKKQAGISALMVLNEFKSMAFSNMSDMFKDWSTMTEFDKLTESQKKGIAEINYKKTKIGDTEMDVEFVKVKMHDKSKALENILKMIGEDQKEAEPQTIKIELSKESIATLNETLETDY